MPDAVVGIVGATIGVGKYIINDYVITLESTESDNGYTMTITKGSDVQTVTLYGATPDALAMMQQVLADARKAADTVNDLGLSVVDGKMCMTYKEE